MLEAIIRMNMNRVRYIIIPALGSDIADYDNDAVSINSDIKMIMILYTDKLSRIRHRIVNINVRYS